MTPQRYNRLTSVLNHRQPDLTVVLENVFDPHNVSAVMRTCDAVGIQDVYILNDGFRHIKNGAKEVSARPNGSQSTSSPMPKACFKEMRNKYKKYITSHLGENSADVYKIDFTRRWRWFLEMKPMA